MRGQPPLQKRTLLAVISASSWTIAASSLSNQTCAQTLSQPLASSVVLGNYHPNPVSLFGKARLFTCLLFKIRSLVQQLWHQIKSL